MKTVIALMLFVMVLVGFGCAEQMQKINDDLNKASALVTPAEFNMQIKPDIQSVIFALQQPGIVTDAKIAKDVQQVNDYVNGLAYSSTPTLQISDLSSVLQDSMPVLINALNAAPISEEQKTLLRIGIVGSETILYRRILQASQANPVGVTPATTPAAPVQPAKM